MNRYINSATGGALMDPQLDFDDPGTTPSGASALFPDTNDILTTSFTSPIYNSDAVVYGEMDTGADVDVPSGGSSTGGTKSGGSSTKRSGTGTKAITTTPAQAAELTPAQILDAINRAPITDACRARALALVNDMLALKLPSPADGVWLQSLVAAAMGNGAYPPECIIEDDSGSDGFPWWGYAAIGGGVCVVAYFLLRSTGKKRKK
jgi:hypothetical protein